MCGDFEEQHDRPFGDAPFPPVVLIAGVAWILFGGLGLANAVAALALLGATPPEQRPGATCAVPLSILFAVAFIVVGFQGIMGTAKDTMGNGVGSILFGLLNLGFGALLLAGSVTIAGAEELAWLIGGGFSVAAGLGLLAAGVLALVGRQDYLAWRRAQKDRASAP
jgi:hypothetical protein